MRRPDRLPERVIVKMSSKAYRAAIKKLGLSQVRAARLFGYSDKHGQRLATGRAEVPPLLVHLITLMLRYDVEPGDLDPRFRSKKQDASRQLPGPARPPG